METQMKTVKAVYAKNFNIVMKQTPYLGEYVIDYTIQGITRYGEPMKDYKLADHMFDLKLQDLEGN